MKYVQVFGVLPTNYIRKFIHIRNIFTHIIVKLEERDKTSTLREDINVGIMFLIECYCFLNNLLVCVNSDSIL